ncbi:cystatin-2-like [Ascaphus truei]|uniref:cystatin-2-like n=1 Tax=Ascaphus truei TaxID=8439 RepID=UPI003F59770B
MWGSGVFVLLLGCLCCLCLSGPLLGKLGLLPGGWSPANLASAPVQEILRFCEEQYNRGSNDAMVYRMVLAVVAQQVVAGINYNVTMILGNTNCRKSQNLATGNCALQTGQELRAERCVFIVYSVPWNSVTTLQSQQCNPY